ncbi:unnamed protein product (macronuclear) [Paramecium tetraurelia]|uniref:Phosducin domain-containing protein n=1 Tax=Paramecium tetraurelia TaxID=5888 RepID=A0DL63_PARTE|nr:uncharacterized protein GSPATT00018097001 [Paramecium tetraurelia]CAK83780.1 unnamed protein product [Paramecium tetraurelia]|eukprot:XP_001451177.1 hypothetical protein (macronuclear) [Paramecium tetraurelia strain d4-2]
MSNSLMGNMLVESVMEKALKDKMKEQQAKQQEEERRRAARRQYEEEDEDDCDDEDLKEMLKKMREQRAKELQEAMLKKNKGFGEYREIVEEEFLPSVTKSEFSVVHFFHRDFERCKIMDKHLQAISQQHPETKFYCLNAEKSPFFVGKLQIQVLPTVCLFVNGVLKNRIVGFEEMGGKDTFETGTLAHILLRYGMIKVRKGSNDDNSSDEDK